MWHCVKINRRRLKCGYVIAVIIIAAVVILLLRDQPMQIRQDTVYDASRWLRDPTTGCQGNFVAYGNQMVVLRYSRFLGNETFAIPCNGKVPGYSFLYDYEGPLGTWLSRLQTYPVDSKPATDKGVKTTPTFVFKRIEAHNLYHTMCEWFNVYMVSKLLNIDPRTADILWLDDRPESPLDGAWHVLFGNVHRYKDLPRDTVFKTLVWSVIGYNSPLNHHNLKEVTYVQEFSRFFLNSFGATRSRALDCSNLHVTVIWRRDYMTHPERKNITNGLVHRKFQNEDEIFKILKSVFVHDVVRTVVLEKLTLKEQIDLITDTDLLVGMHGAGMAHVMFLPTHASVLEFFPNYWGFLRHFKMFSKWRGIKYVGWQNQDPRNEYIDFYTKIPKEVVRVKAMEARSKIC